jgi:hypothetical protein
LKGKNKLIRTSALLFLLLFSLAINTPIHKAMATESECIRCHTNLKKLMDLSWEVKKIKPEQELSKEISGEG